MKGRYEESSIRVLKGLQPVRERPGMYTRTTDPTHIVQEVDRQRRRRGAGRVTPRASTSACTPIGSVSVEDDGRGIPVGIASGGEGLHRRGRVHAPARRRQVRQEGRRGRLRVLRRPARRRRLGDQCAVAAPRGGGQARRQGAPHRVRGRRRRGEAQGDRHLRAARVRHDGARLAGSEVLRFADGLGAGPRAPAARQGGAAARREGHARTSRRAGSGRRRPGRIRAAWRTTCGSWARA